MSVCRRISVTAVAACALSLAACSGGPSRPQTVPPPAAASGADEARAILDLLVSGQDATAKKRLKVLLKREPMNPAARVLSDSIERDSKDLLGPDSYPYVVKPGDTIIGLAQRLLGNELKAVQLARYNGLKVPVVLSAGQTLRIPGEPPRVDQPRRVEPARPPVVVKPAPGKPATVKIPPAKPAPAVPAKVAPNPSAARAARTAGLAALNQGNVLRAVGLLRRASALDPENPAIARDLSRAERIAATVKARR